MKNLPSSKNDGCFRMGCVDLFVFLSISVALMNMAFAVYEGMEIEEFQKFINSSLLALGCILCLLFALPCWRLNPSSSNISGAFGLILMGHALGYGVVHGYLIYSETVGARGNSNISGIVYRDVGGFSIESLKDEITIVGFSIAGLGLVVLSMIHEFGLKYNRRLSFCYILSYIIYASIIAVSGIICWAFTVPLVDGLNWFKTEKQLEPLIVTGVFRCGSAIAILSCLIRSFGTSIWSTFVLSLMFVCNISMLVVAAAQFRFSPYSDWFGYGPGMNYHNEVLGLWILTTSLVGLVAIVNMWFYPTPKFVNYCSTFHNVEQQREMNGFAYNPRTHQQQQQNEKPLFIIPDAKDGQLTPTTDWV